MKYLYLVLALILGTYDATATTDSTPPKSATTAYRMTLQKKTATESSWESEEVAGSVTTYEIDQWFKDNLSDVVSQILPEDAFGKKGDENIDVKGVVQDMYECFYNKGKKSTPHIAVMRVVVDTADNEQYIFPIPYIFASGIEGTTGRWSNFLNCRKTDEGQYSNLKNALEVWHSVAEQNSSDKAGALKASKKQKYLLDAFSKTIEKHSSKFSGTKDYTTNKTNIDSIVKCIGDYKYGTGRGHEQFFAHSERAAILCLLADDSYSLEKIYDVLSKKKKELKRITIQIRTINRVCRDCQDFLGGDSCMNKKTKRFIIKGEKFKLHENLPEDISACPIIINAGTPKYLVMINAS